MSAVHINNIFLNHTIYMLISQIIYFHIMFAFRSVVLFSSSNLPVRKCNPDYGRSDDSWCSWMACVSISELCLILSGFLFYFFCHTQNEALIRGKYHPTGTGLGCLSKLPAISFKLLWKTKRSVQCVWHYRNYCSGSLALYEGILDVWGVLLDVALLEHSSFGFVFHLRQHFFIISLCKSSVTVYIV